MRGSVESGVRHDDGMSQFSGEVPQQRCIGTVVEGGERVGIPVAPMTRADEAAHVEEPVRELLHLSGRPAHVAFDGDPAAEALPRGG
jgi:hypothetical protein